MKQFGGFPEALYSKDKAAVVILPIPFDQTSTWMPGSDKGPNAIIEASEILEYFDIETQSEVCERGFWTESPIESNDPEKMIERAYLITKRYLSKGQMVVALGGEHTVSIGPAKAYAEHFHGLSVLQLDAHSDLRDEYLGSKYNHACTMMRIMEFAPLVQVGIRSMEKHHESLNPGRIYYAERIHNQTEWMQQAIDQLSENVYITIDLDAFDPSVILATGTPNPGGLQWYQTLTFLKKVCEQKNVVGFDVVELCPHPEIKASDFIAAKLIYKLISYILELPKK